MGENRYCSIQSACINGLVSEAINVQISATTGLPQETIIGLPDTIVKESRNRIKSAIQLSGFKLPAMAYTINLSPVDVQKRSNSLELAIAVGLLTVTKQISIDSSYCFLGALSLDGAIEPVRHMLPLIHFYDRSDITFVIPKKNIADISPLHNIRYIAIDHLTELSTLATNKPEIINANDCVFSSIPHEPHGQFDSVNGHFLAKQACAIAIAGRHPLLFVGSPGIGKTMLIDCMPSLQPPLPAPAIIENLCIQSLVNQPLTYTDIAPFRTPHHTTSYAGMIGGQNPPKPGEITRANHGILFLDELGEYHRNILETLREPLETQKIQISRAGNAITFPAHFLLSAAMNPCYCGQLFNDQHACVCNPAKVSQYWHKLSQPLIDRFSICMILKKPAISNDSSPTINQSELENMVAIATNAQKYRNPKGCFNHYLSNDECLSICSFESDSLALIDRWIHQQGLSFRARFRLIKLSLTVADCFGSSTIRNEDISFAIQLSEHTKLPR